MSTRAHIRIKSGDEQIMLYHHHDGNPECLGVNLKSFIEEHYKPGRLPFTYVANDLIKGKIRHCIYNIWTGKEEIKSDDEYEVTTRIHGDEDYVYVIDCEERSIRCYRHYWDEPFEKTVIPEREVDIVSYDDPSNAGTPSTEEKVIIDKAEFVKWLSDTFGADYWSPETGDDHDESFYMEERPGLTEFYISKRLFSHRHVESVIGEYLKDKIIRDGSSCVIMNDVRQSLHVMIYVAEKNNPEV